MILVVTRQHNGSLCLCRYAASVKKPRAVSDEEDEDDDVEEQGGTDEEDAEVRKGA